MFKKPLTSELRFKVPFYDVDQMRIVWHGNYVKYLERARCELLDRFNYGYREMEKTGYGWPVVDLRCKYVRPARFDQEICITATLVEYENRIKIDYLIVDGHTGEKLTKAHSIQVAVEMESGELQFVSPPIVRERLECHGFL